MLLGNASYASCSSWGGINVSNELSHGSLCNTEVIPPPLFIPLSSSITDHPVYLIYELLKMCLSTCV